MTVEPTLKPRAEMALVALAVIGVWAHQAWLAGWFVDDAAISFTYARHLAAGLGFVAVPGGERVEGFSDPLWVVLLAGFEAVGLDGFTTAKPLAALFSAITAVFVWQIARRCLPAGDPLALVAPFALALDARFAIWSASGLENALFACLLTGGVLGVQTGRLGPAGLALGGLAVTRPEGIGYAGVTCAWAAAMHGRAAWRTAVLALGPFLAWEGFRLAYFAWPLPNTFYAKVGAPDRLDWDGRGWTQAREWAVGSGWLAVSPALVLAVVGRSGTAVAVGLVVGLAVLGPWPLLAVAAVAGLAAGLPLAARTPTVGLVAHLVAFGGFYAVWVDGDWMRGHRWFSWVAPPLCVLLAVGLREVVDGLRVYVRDADPHGRTAWIVGVGVLGALAPGNTAATEAFARQPVDWPELVARRLRHTDAFAERLGLERFQVSTLEMDMGAHMFWSAYQLVDLAGLIDVPISRHRFTDRAFLQQYLFEERRPTFAHVHRQWAKVSGVPQLPGWSRDYVQILPYMDGEQVHDGVFVRRDSFLRPGWDGPAVDARWGGLSLVGARVRSPEAQGFAVVELAWRATGYAKGDPLPLATLEVGPVRTHIALGLDLVTPDAWGTDTFVGRVRVPVGAFCCGDLPVRVRVDILPVIEPITDLPVLDGSVALPLTIRAVPDVTPYAEADRQAVQAAASEGRCLEAEEAWRAVRDHGPAASWVAGVLPAVRTSIASCWVSGPTPTVADVERARRWDPLAPDVVRVGEGMAGPLREQAERAMSAGDPAGAYARWSDVLRVTPWDAWSRRHAEQARDLTLR